MELLLRLSSFGVNSELSRDEFMRKMRCVNSAEQMRSLRQLLFEDAVGRRLADDVDVLVMRKKTNAGKSVVEKHVEDVWTLSCAIERNEGVPCILLRNSKCRKEEFVRSQSRQRQKKTGEVGCQMKVEGVNESPGLGSGHDIKLDVANIKKKRIGAASMEMDECSASASANSCGTSHSALSVECGQDCF